MLMSMPLPLAMPMPMPMPLFCRSSNLLSARSVEANCLHTPIVTNGLGLSMNSGIESGPSAATL